MARRRHRRNSAGFTYIVNPAAKRAKKKRAKRRTKAARAARGKAAPKMAKKAARHSRKGRKHTKKRKLIASYKRDETVKKHMRWVKNPRKRRRRARRNYAMTRFAPRRHRRRNPHRMVHRRRRRNPGMLGGIQSQVMSLVRNDVPAGAIAGAVNALLIEQALTYLTVTSPPVQFLAEYKQYTKPLLRTVAGIGLGLAAQKFGPGPIKGYAGGIVSGFTAIAANELAASLFSTPAGQTHALVDHYAELVARQAPGTVNTLPNASAQNFGALSPPVRVLQHSTLADFGLDNAYDERAVE
jgi:hypothetical protein